MTDIVERLRQHDAQRIIKSIASEAADEIERLRAALLECKSGAEYPDELGDIIDAALGHK